MSPMKDTIDAYRLPAICWLNTCVCVCVLLLFGPAISSPRSVGFSGAHRPPRGCSRHKSSVEINTSSEIKQKKNEEKRGENRPPDLGRDSNPRHTAKMKTTIRYRRRAVPAPERHVIGYLFLFRLFSKRDTRAWVRGMNIDQ